MKNPTSLLRLVVPLLLTSPPARYYIFLCIYNKKDRGWGLQKALLGAKNIGKYRARQECGLAATISEFKQILPDISRNYFWPRRHMWKT
jgi:hypothetical protein